MQFKISGSAAAVALVLSMQGQSHGQDLGISIASVDGFIGLVDVQFSCMPRPEIDGVDESSAGSEIEFAPNITLDNGLKINGNITVDPGLIPPGTAIPVGFATDEIGELGDFLGDLDGGFPVLVVADNRRDFSFGLAIERPPAERCYDVLRDLLRKLREEYGDASDEYIDLLASRRADLAQLKREVIPQGRLWLAISDMERAIAEQMDALQRTVGLATDTEYDLGFKWEIGVYGAGGISDTRFGNTQETEESFQYGAKVRLSHELLVQGGYSADFGIQGTFFATDNDRIVNFFPPGGGTPIGEGGSVKAVTVGPGFAYRPNDWLLFQAHFGLGGAFENYKLSQFGNLVVSDNTASPAYIIGGTAAARVYDGVYLGGTVDWLGRRGSQVDFVNGGFSVKRGWQTAWMVGVGVIVFWNQLKNPLR